MYLRKPLRPNWRTSHRKAIPERKDFSDRKSTSGTGDISVGGLLADITHEVRTPMNGMFGMLDFLLSSPLTEDQREAAMTAQAAAEDLLALFNNIVDLPMAEADSLPLRRSSFEFDSTLKALFDDISARAGVKGIDVETRYASADDSPVVVGDIDRLRQVFSNLLMYMMRQLAREKILVEVSRTPFGDGKLMLSVCMRANGSASVQRIFVSEKRESASSRHFDAGELGLVVCRRLVAMMNGKLEVACGHEGGVQIRVSLAFDIAPAALSGIRVLLVDGDAERRASLMNVLASQQIRVDTAAEPAEAFDVLANARAANDDYRMILLSRHLRGMDGEDFGRAIKTDSDHRDSALVLLGSGDRAGLARAGFAAMVSDASDTQSLLSSMEKLCLSTSLGKSGIFIADGQFSPQGGDMPGFVGKRILVVDDDAVNRRVASRMLEELGCSVDVACDGKQALSMHAATPYDLILMDCEMPFMDGFEATAEIRAAEAAGSRTPVIAWTARFMAEGAGKLLAEGFDDLMPKPMRRQALQDMLSAWIPAQTASEETAESDEDKEIAELRQTFGDGFGELAALFRSDSSKRISALQTAASDKDAALIAKIAHAFSGSAASIGAAGLSALCKELEMRARAGKLEDIGQRLRAIETEFARVSEKL